MQNWSEVFQFYCEERNRQFLSDRMAEAIAGVTEKMDDQELARWQRVAEEWQERGVELRQSSSKIRIDEVREGDPYVHIFYRIITRWRLQQENFVYEQAWTEQRCCLLKKDVLGWRIVEDEPLDEQGVPAGDGPQLTQQRNLREARIATEPEAESRNLGSRARYDRQQAVEYAEQWWNDYNPQFKQFDVDCTNYVSQCLWAGGAPMEYAAVRDKGWWYRFDEVPQWSFSWAVAHSLRWYLPAGSAGLRATEVSSAAELEPGDVIVYDFDGDGRWEHNTIVVAKDGQGEPLVNAHTTNSRLRYWSYRDSHAWTEQTAYKFFRISDDF